MRTEVKVAVPMFVLVDRTGVEPVSPAVKEGLATVTRPTGSVASSA